MGDICKAARAAVESLEMRPVMFETEPAGGEDSWRALLDRVARGRVWRAGPARVSPTEEEFNEARERGIELLAVVQQVDRHELAQQEFIARVRGSWEDGHFAP
jgi:hypothetical protein